MHNIYNIVIYLVSFFLKGIALFNSKIALFVKGRKNTFSYLQEKISNEDTVIWIHTASLGEYEQGLPIIEKLKVNYPNHKILVTFFSPSGYEIKKNTSIADFVCYLPLDTKYNAKKFIELVNPQLVIFVKYEIWPSFLKALNVKQVPVLLTSAIFNKKQLFFKWYGGFMRNSLSYFTHIFVQDQKSIQLLNSIDIKNTTVSGDTRFDRVSEILTNDNSLDFMDSFRQKNLCFIAGSTWPQDENLLIQYINSSTTSLKYVIAPHNIKPTHIQELKEAISKKCILYSEVNNKDIFSYDVLIIDTIGILTKIYSYANIGYVGGGFATGLHNTLEPAVFGIPIIIGPQFDGFKEAKDLVDKKGIIPVTSASDFNPIVDKLYMDKEFCKATGAINKDYVSINTGASNIILDYIKQQTLL